MCPLRMSGFCWPVRLLTIRGPSWGCWRLDRAQGRAVWGWKVLVVNGSNELGVVLPSVQNITLGPLKARLAPFPQGLRDPWSPRGLGLSCRVIAEQAQHSVSS